MFNVETLGGIVSQLKNLYLPKLSDEEAETMLGCVNVLELAMVSLTESYIILQNLDPKVNKEIGQDPTNDPDISYLIKAYTDLNTKVLNGNKVTTAKYLNSLKVTLNSVLKVLQYINSFDKITKPDDIPRIILLS
jgi:hypothetical protein